MLYDDDDAVYGDGDHLAVVCASAFVSCAFDII